MEARPLAPHNLTHLVLGVGKKGAGIRGQSFVSTGVGGRALPLGTKWKEWSKFVCFCKAASIHLTSFSLP